MEGPVSTAEQTTTGGAHKFGGEAGAKAGILVAEATGKATYDYTRSSSTSVTKTHVVDGLAKVSKDIADSAYIVFLDDFHYIAKENQDDVAKHIKSGAERGIKICIATVPHRADDVVRMNHELRGRLAQVDTSFWTLQELKQIALAGFPKLNAEISHELATRLAREACGSPQLMQRICLDVCFDLGLEVELSNRKRLNSMSRDCNQFWRNLPPTQISAPCWPICIKGQRHEGLSAVSTSSLMAPKVMFIGCCCLP